MKNASHLFQGILNRSMLMGETRDWLDTGDFWNAASKPHVCWMSSTRFAARLSGRRDGCKKLGIEPLGVGSLLDMHGWIAVLKSVSAFEMYRKTYTSGIRPAQVMEFLILNPQFPASARHCIARVEGCLRRISGNQLNEPATEPERIIGRLLADLTYSRPEEIIVNGLHEFLDDVQTRCTAVGNAITRTYLLY